MMLAIAPFVDNPLDFPAMAKGNSKPVNFRINRALLKEARDVGDTIQPFPPTLTAIVEAALREWIERNRPKRAKGAKE